MNLLSSGDLHWAQTAMYGKVSSFCLIYFRDISQGDVNFGMSLVFKSAYRMLSEAARMFEPWPEKAVRLTIPGVRSAVVLSADSLDSQGRPRFEFVCNAKKHMWNVIHDSGVYLKMTTLVNSHRLHTYSALLTYVNIIYQLVLRLCEVEDSCLYSSLSVAAYAVLFIVTVLEENLE
jgi:hypothetical protein